MLLLLFFSFFISTFLGVEGVQNMAEKKNRFRDKQLLIRLSEEELNILEVKAEIADKSKSDFVRDIVLYGEVKSKSLWNNIDFKKLLYEINRIGNNLNQIAYNSNLKKSTGREEIYALRELYESLLSLYEDTFLYPEAGGENNGNNEES